MEDELFILTSSGDGEKMICPDLSDGLSTSSEWIAGYLPDVFYDIDQGGNLRKSVEAEALFKLISLACVIGSYRGEVIEHVKNYDFETMTSKDTAVYNSFVAHLQKYSIK